MAERVVRIRLAAEVQGYKNAMKEAAEQTKKTGTEAEVAADKVRAYKDAFTAVGAVGVAVGATLAAGFGLAVKAMADFDSQMSAVQAATHESAENMDLLRQAALDAGESTVYSATEAASAIEELAKAGVSTKDILGGGLAGALDLAAAGGIEVADAAGIAATALKQFNLNGSDMAHVADLLAAGAGKAQGDVTDLSQALNQSALIAKQTGLSIEETTAGLSAFAASGLLGSDAGTSFKTMLQSLNPTSAAAADLMKKYNLEAYDAQGNFVGLSTYAGKLKDGLSGLSTEQQNATLKTIFGADAVRAATVLYQNGAEGIDEWTQAVDDQGYAAETARMRLDNLKGDVEALGGAFETALIDTGSTANDTLRTMVQALTGLVGMYNDMPPAVQGTVMALGGATAAVALSGGAAFLAVPKWLEFKATVEASSWSMKGIALTAGTAGLALGGLFMIVGELAAEHQRAQQKAQAYADTLSEGTHQITDDTRDLIAEQINLQQNGFLWLEGSSMADAARDLGISLDVVRKAVEGDADALDTLNVKTQEAIDGYSFFDQKSIELNSSAEYLRSTVEKETGALDDAAEAARNKAEATNESTTSADSAAEAYTAEADAVTDLNSQLTDLIDQINAANGVAVDAITANSNYLSALDGLKTQVEKTGTSLDESSVSGSANAAAMGELAEKARAAADAQLQQDLAVMDSDSATKKYLDTLASQRQAFIDAAVSAGYNADEVNALADRIFQMPDEKTTKMLVEKAQAQSAIDEFITLNDGRRVKVFVDAVGNESFKVGTRTVSGMSTGGPVRGPGPKGVDSELRRLAPGEHVIPADEVDAAGGHNQIEAWRAMLRSGEHGAPSYTALSEQYKSPGEQYRYAQPSPQVIHVQTDSAPAQMSFPDSITLVDQDGSILTRARVIANAAVLDRAMQLSRTVRAGKRRDGS
ncbi:phage tail tape measure protein [Microbacterium sp. EST19A]|uniref:phage tail tape measure protein n=1 Tax=Microbacterium sp. EST19A TaxID=2862681 RepID=UPI001CBC96E0|nr:phage tail tape measure protein [Microbacterium sp. EST19A]